MRRLLILVALVATLAAHPVAVAQANSWERSQSGDIVASAVATSTWEFTVTLHSNSELSAVPPLLGQLFDDASNNCGAGFSYSGSSHPLVDFVFVYDLDRYYERTPGMCLNRDSMTMVPAVGSVKLHIWNKNNGNIDSTAPVVVNNRPAEWLYTIATAAPPSPEVAVTRAPGGGYGINWTPVEGATGYRIDVHRPKATAQGKYGYSIFDWEFQELAKVSGTTLSFTTDDTSYPESHGFDKSVAFSVTAVTPTGEGPRAIGRAGCAQAYFISARGSGQNPDNEPLNYEQGLGARGLRVYEDLRERLGRTRSAFQANAVNYPAAPASLTFYDPRFRAETYDPSVQGGTTTAQAQFQTISARCPGALIVGFGFSQGAQVIGNAFQALPAPVKQKVLGVQLLGDPIRNPSDSGIWQGPQYDPEPGIIPETRDPFTSVTQPLQVMSWCWRGDDVCSARLRDGITFHVETGKPDYYMCYERWAAYRVTMLARNRGWVPRNVEKPGCTVIP